MEDTLETGILDRTQDVMVRYMPFIAEIRNRLFFLAAVFVIAAGIGFFYYEKIIILILKAFDLNGVNVVFTSPFQFFNLSVSSAFLLGILAVFPFFVYQILSFLKPALRPVEYRTIISLLPLSILLFAGGFAFGLLIMRWVVQLFYQKSLSLNIGNYLDISHLLSQILITSILLGIAFQFPIVLTVLMRLKIVKYKTLAKKRMIVYAVSIIFAAALPPTDLVSMTLMSILLILLFEIMLLLNKVILKSHLLYEN